MPRSSELHARQRKTGDYEQRVDEVPRRKSWRAAR